MAAGQGQNRSGGGGGTDRSYVSFEAYRSFNPLIAALGAEDDNRRYEVEGQSSRAPAAPAFLRW